MKNKDDKIATMIIAMLCSFKLINYSLTYFFNKSDGGYLTILFTILFITYFSYLTLKILKRKNHFKIRFPIYGLFFLVYIMVLFAFKFDKTNLTFIELISYCLLPVIIGINENIKTDKLLKYIMAFSLVSFLSLDKLLEVRWYGSIGMDISYAFLPTISAAIVHFFYYRKYDDNKIINLFLYIVNLFYLYQIVLYGERGTLFSIVILFILCIIFKQVDNKTIILNKTSFLKITILIIAVMGILLSYNEIINFIINTLKIDSYALNKIKILSNSDISNGRFKIYGQALKGFAKSPIFGNGISSFKFYYPGNPYPHNILLQLLFDGGILLFLMFIVVLIRGVRITLESKDKNSNLLIMYFFSISIMYLFFSNDIWVLPSLWIFYGFLVKKNAQRRIN